MVRDEHGHDLVQKIMIDVLGLSPDAQFWVWVAIGAFCLSYFIYGIYLQVK